MLAYTIIMFTGKLFEIIGKDYFGHFGRTVGCRHFIQLQQKTFLQIRSTDTGRIKFLYELKDACYICLRNIYIAVKGKVIDDAHDISAQIAVIVYTADHLLCNLLFCFCKIQQPNLA
ncbi:hypothetical protein D9M68_876870 [compost metagenome]